MPGHKGDLIKLRIMFSRILKEIFDRTVAVIGFIAMSPSILLIGLLIKVESSGPVLFKHRRIGKNGKSFWMYKFRKMAHNLNVGPKISPKYDSRLTKVGRVLERLKLDEIPQLINIIKGDMSFVGPRPEIPEIVDLYTLEQRKVLTVKPGLVGPNQIIWRNEKNLYPENLDDVEAYYIKNILPVKLQRDIKYAENANFLSDIKYFVFALGVTIFEPFKISHIKRRRRLILKLMTDIGLSGAAYIAALFIKYDLQIGSELLRHGIIILPVLFCWQIIGFTFLGAPHQTWRYFCKADLVVLVKVITGAVLLTVAVLYPFIKPTLPFSFWILYSLLCLCFLSGMRFFISYKESPARNKSSHQKNVLIYGANREGELFTRRLLANLEPRVKPIAFLDCDLQKRGLTIHGIKIMGNAHDLPLLKSLHDIDEIYITVQDESNGDLKSLIKFCDEFQIKYHFVFTTYSSQNLENATEDGSAIYDKST